MKTPDKNGLLPTPVNAVVDSSQVTLSSCPYCGAGVRPDRLQKHKEDHRKRRAALHAGMRPSRRPKQVIPLHSARKIGQQLCSPPRYDSPSRYVTCENCGTSVRLESHAEHKCRKRAPIRPKAPPWASGSPVKRKSKSIWKPFQGGLPGLGK